MNSHRNVDQLMREVAQAAAHAGPEPPFPQLALQRLLPELRERHVVEPRPPLIGRTRYERLWVRINTFVRRFAAHAVEPAVAQQNEFNTALLHTLEELIAADAAIRGTIVALQAEKRGSKDD
jgi:hypothetical protein